MIILNILCTKSLILTLFFICEPSILCSMLVGEESADLMLVRFEFRSMESLFSRRRMKISAAQTPHQMVSIEGGLVGDGPRHSTLPKHREEKTTWMHFTKCLF